MKTSEKAPNGALIQLTKFCNFSCKHCSQKAPNYGANERNSDLSFEAWINIFHRVRNTGITRLRFTGGETFLRKDLELLCCKAKELGFEISFVTNGSLILPKNIDWLVRLKPESIWISIYGFPESIYHNISRTKDLLPRIIFTVQHLLEEDQEVGIYYPLGSHNCNEIENFISYFYSLGVRHIKFIQLMQHGRALESKELSSIPNERLKKILTDISKRVTLCPDMNIKVSMFSGQSKLFCSSGYIIPDDRSCKLGLQNLWTITSDGSVHPCCLFMNDNACILFNATSPEEFVGWNKWDNSNVLNRLGKCKNIRTCPALPDTKQNPANAIGDFVCPLIYAEIQS